MSLALRLLHTDADGFEAEFARLRDGSAGTDTAIEERVAAILEDVRERGDAAVLDLTAQLDGLQANSVAELEIPAGELDAALRSVAPQQRRALEQAAERIRRYHERQLEACGRSWSYRDADGSLLGQKVTPIDRVGIYVPGGKAAYPSSVLMNAVPSASTRISLGPAIMSIPTRPNTRRLALAT